MTEIENQPEPVNGSEPSPPPPPTEEQLAGMTDGERAAIAVNQLMEAVLRRLSHGSKVNAGILLALVSIQGHQLKALMTLLADTKAVDAGELNRRIAANCQEEIDQLRAAPNIQVAKSVMDGMRRP